jgi:hypothetical protein
MLSNARLGFLTLLLFATATAFAYDCKVSCPTGYHGGCVKSSSGCDCSCKKEAKDVISDILTALQRSGASKKLVDNAALALQGKEELKENLTLTDEETGKTFIISMNKQ